eukprot:scaffold26.g3331.t1
MSRAESRLSLGGSARSGSSPAKSAGRRVRGEPGAVDSALGSRRTTGADDDRPDGERVKVFVRVRPTRAEGETSGAVTIKPDGRGLVVCRDHGSIACSEFDFDAVLPPGATQSDVYQAAVRPIVEDVLAGYNGTVMAYGQTGAGKTFTLSSVQPTAIGMVPRALAEVFSAIAADPSHDYTCHLSYIQIYMELIQDLLRPDSDNLQIREREQGGVFVSGVCQKEVASIEQCLALLQQGDRNRTTAFTALNASSSRSHAVMMLTVTKRKQVAGTDLGEIMRVKVGQLFMVDLAGSERLKKSKSTGLRATEAKSINLSLTTLGMCINARADPAATHVPFRDSKLTRLLQESLGGNAKTSLIVACCDAAEHVDETLQSLQFGSRAMCVRTAAVVNETVDYHSQDAEVIAALDQRSALLEQSLLAKENELESMQAQLRVRVKTMRLGEKEQESLEIIPACMQAAQLESARVVQALRQEREEAEVEKQRLLQQRQAELAAEQQRQVDLEARLQQSAQQVEGLLGQHERERQELLDKLACHQQQLQAAQQAGEEASRAHSEALETLRQQLEQQLQQRAEEAAEEAGRLEAGREAEVASLREELALVQRQLLGSREEVRILTEAHEQAAREAEASWQARLQEVEAAAERRVAAVQATVADRERTIAELQAEAAGHERGMAALREQICSLEAGQQVLRGQLACSQKQGAALEQLTRELEATLAAEKERVVRLRQQVCGTVVDAYERSRLNLAATFSSHKKVSDAARIIQRHYRQHRMRHLRRQQSEGCAALSEAKTALGSLAAQHAELERRRRANMAFSGQTLVGDSLNVLQDAVEAIVAAFVLPARDLRSVQRYNQKLGVAASHAGSLSARGAASASTVGLPGATVGASIALGPLLSRKGAAGAADLNASSGSQLQRLSSADLIRALRPTYASNR